MPESHIKNEFIHNGFVRVDNAFPAELAEEVRRILWSDLGLDRDDPSTWTQPVIRLGMYSQKPFIDAANTVRLHGLFDQLVGDDNWMPCRSMGTFPVRFPAAGDPGDTGWHVDASFSGADATNYFEWRVNYKSKGRALLMLFLFSDVTEVDAPTKIRIGSHLDVAALLKPAGEEGLSFTELAESLSRLPERDVTTATGKAGTVYLCHPFIAHASQPHRGTQPRFLAQPPLLLKNDVILEGKDGAYSALEESIRSALKLYY